MNVGKVLREARDLMNDNGTHWIGYDLTKTLRNKENKGEKAYCAFGAVNHITGSQQRLFVTDKNRLPLLALANAIREEQGHKPVVSWSTGPDSEIISTIYNYNDNLARGGKKNWPKIRAVFTKAARSPRKYINQSKDLL